MNRFMSWYLATWEERFEEGHFVEVTRIRYIRDEDGPVHCDLILVNVASDFENKIFLKRVDLVDKTFHLTPEQQKMWDRLVDILGEEKTLTGDDRDWFMRVCAHSRDRDDVDNFYVRAPKEPTIGRCVAQ